MYFFKNSKTYLKIKIAFWEVIHDPATTIALGSVVMSYAMGGLEAVVLNAAAVTLIGGLKVYEVWTGKEKGRPFGALACVNFATAASIAFKGFEQHGIDPAIIPQASVALAYILWGTRSTLLSLQQRFNFKHKSFRGDPQFYQGLGAVATAPSVGGIPAFIGILGVARTFKQNVKGIFLRHATAARLYAIQYAVSTSITLFLNKPEEALAWAIWTWAFSRFDRDKDQELINIMKQKLNRKFS